MSPTPIPYLFFQGCCAEAMTTYAKVFGAPKPEFFTVGDSPMAKAHPASAHALIMHSVVEIGDSKIFGSDDIEGGTPAMAGVSLNISFPDAAKSRAVFDTLAEGGTIRMPFTAHFFSPGMGSLTDRFGIRWMIMTDDPNRPSA